MHEIRISLSKTKASGNLFKPIVLCYNTFRMIKNSDSIIIGAGLAGCVMAMTLAKKGYKVTIYEVKPDPRKIKVNGGRSYNLQLYPRGIDALKKLGIWDETFPLVADAVEGYMNHAHNGRTMHTKLNASRGEYFYQIHREALSLLLLNKAATYQNIAIHFNSHCVFLDRKNTIVKIIETKTKKITKKKANVIIGADGVNSIIRGFIQQGKQATHYQEIFPWGYKEIPLSPEKVKQLALLPHTTHRWPRKDALLIGFPNKDRSLTLMMMLPLKGKRSFATLTTKPAISTFVKETYPDLLPLLPQFEHALIKNPIGKLISLATSPWHYKNSVGLIGDAAHAILPFYGQGMNAAFEDCLLLNDLMDKYKDNWDIIFPEFQKLRKPHTDIIHQLAKENFISLKDESRKPFYLMKDKIHTYLHELFPSNITQPLYKSIIYTTHPFADIYLKHKKQEEIFRLVGIDIITFIMSLVYSVLQILHSGKRNRSRIT